MTCRAHPGIRIHLTLCDCGAVIYAPIVVKYVFKARPTPRLYLCVIHFGFKIKLRFGFALKKIALKKWNFSPKLSLPAMSSELEKHFQELPLMEILVFDLFMSDIKMDHIDQNMNCVCLFVCLFVLFSFRQ